MALRLSSKKLVLQLFCLPVVYTATAYADELEAFQTGLIGSGYGYSVINGLQTELQLKTVNTYGKSTFKDIPNERVSAQKVTSSLKTATAYRASPEFYMIGYTDLTLISHSEEARIENADLSTGANSISFGTRLVYEKGSLTIGGSVGIVNFAPELRELNTAGESFESETGWAVLPQLELIGGYKWKKTSNLLRAKFYSQGEFEVTTKNGESDITFDKYRKLPSELSLSSLVDINSQFQAAVNLKFTGSAQASNTSDEWSVSFADNGARRVSGEKKNTNKYAASLGGRFFPTDKFSVSSSISYETSSYVKEDYASVDEDNFGGLGFNFATEFIPLENSRVQASGSYTVPTSVSYTQTNGGEQVLNHQQITTGVGSASTKTAASFSLTLGGTYMF